jgi:midasin (ATPase involved in ribosome maturation)
LKICFKLKKQEKITLQDCPPGVHPPHENHTTSSRFDWVDSVLVHSLLQGEWAVFENSNLCNPSILDRLNPLLEEGNHSLCINEQGLSDNDQLRVITAHPYFRALFVVSEVSLRDQGRDVSRALKNRCLQVHVNYINGSELSEGSEIVIESRMMQIDWDLDVVKTRELQKAGEGQTTY